MMTTIIQAALWLVAIAVVVGTYYGVRPKRRSVQAPEGATSKFCPHCGKMLVPGTRFCAECGGAVDEFVGVPIPVAAPSWSAIRVVGLVCGILVSGLFLSAALFLGAGSGVKGIWQTTEAQLAAANTAVGTPQASTEAATATPTGSESGQPAQSEASAPVQESASGLLESCISGGQKPELACLSEELDRQDARLNNEYQRVMAQYKQLGQGDHIATLRKAELDWIKHVKSDCDSTPPGFMGNPDHRRIECRLDLTKARADELAKLPH